MEQGPLNGVRLSVSVKKDRHMRGGIVETVDNNVRASCSNTQIGESQIELPNVLPLSINHSIKNKRTYIPTYIPRVVSYSSRDQRIVCVMVA